MAAVIATRPSTAATTNGDDISVIDDHVAGLDDNDDELPDGIGATPSLTRQRSHSDSDATPSMVGDLVEAKATVGGKDDDKENMVQVVCRFRPENDEEMKKGRMICDFPRDDDTSVHLNVEGKPYRFQYDRMFRPHGTQGEVFDAIGKPIVSSVMAGYNSCIMAYGQTGSGKTYTMLGPGFDGKESSDEKVLTDPGLIPRVMEQLFRDVEQSQSETMEYRLRASYVEIYNELIRDMLAPRMPNQRAQEAVDRVSLKIEMDDIRGLWIPDATQVPIHGLVDVFAVLRLGAQRRVMASTNSNEHSSRSHAIFIVSLECRNHIAHTTNVSQLFLVDLAGSEKVGKTNAQGLRLREAQSINQSLSTLGLVIFALSGLRKKKTVFVPYRNSKLTRLLQNCIGGNARTTLVICTSPSTYNDKETLSTLRFGERCSMIKNAPKVNTEPTYGELKQMLRLSQDQVARQLLAIKQLEDEIKVLKQIAAFDALNRRIPAMIINGSGASNGTPSQPSTPTTPARPITIATGRLPTTPTHNNATLSIMPPQPGALISMTPTANGAPPRSPLGGRSNMFVISGTANNGSTRPASAPVVKDAWDQQPGITIDPITGMATTNNSATIVATSGGDNGSSSGNNGRDIDTIADVERGESAAAAATPALPTPLEETKDVVLIKPKADGVATSMNAFIENRRHKMPDMREMILHFICPLSKYVMVDPVLALDGFTYDRRAIETFMMSHRVSPLTGKKMGGKLLIPNHNLKNQIRKYFPNAPQRQAVSQFQIIPIACINLIFGMMDHRQLCRSFQVCREWRTVGNDDRLWRSLIYHRFGVMKPTIATGTTYKDDYQSRWSKEQASRAPRGGSGYAYGGDHYSNVNRTVIGKVVQSLQ